MILIPGLSSGGETWDGTVDHYKDRYECHVLTVAGFNGVPRIPEPMLDTVRDAIGQYIRDKKLVKPVIVGHSLGGDLALELGAKFPDLVGPLVIVDSYPYMAGIADPSTTLAQAKEMAGQMRKYIAGDSQEAYERYVKSGMSTRDMVTSEAGFAKLTEWGLKSDRFAVADAMAELFSIDLRDEIAKIKSPTLVLGSWIAFKQYTDHDKTVANLKAQYARLAGVEVRVHDTSRHFIMWDDPNWMFAQIDGFLSAGAKVSGR